MFSADEFDVFSINSWNATFQKPLNSWVVEVRNKARSGFVPIVLGAALAAPAQAHYRNMVAADAGTRGPPVAAQEVRQSVFVSAPRSESNARGVKITLPAKIEPAERIADFQVLVDEDGNTAYSPAVLNRELRILQDIRHDVAAMVSIDPRTVRVASLISGQIPSPIAPTIGFDDEGNVFLHFKNKRVDAYLTIEQRAFHLFCKVEGQKNFYLDDEPLVGKRLPRKIRDKFSEMFRT